MPLSPQGFPLRFRQRFTRPIAARRRALLALAACVTACVALSLAGPAAAADISLVASVEPNPLTVGDSAVLTLEFSGSQDVPVPDLGNLDGLSAQYLGPSTQVSIVNGQVSASVSHRFRLVAQRAGQFRLGPFRVEYQGKTYTSNPVPLRVLTQAQASTAGGNLPRPSGVDQLRLAVVPQKTQAYVGERVPIQIKLYVGNVRVDDLQFPEMNSDAIVLDKLQQPARQNEILQGRRWQTLRFDTEMTALKPGEIDIPATMAMSVLVNRRGRGDPLFDQFFGQTERRQVQVRADPVHLTVRPLPEAAERMAGYRAFGNKIWNATRFALARVDPADRVQADLGAFAGADLGAPERWILSRLSRTAAEVGEKLAAYRFDEACHRLYHFFWGELCDWYIELAKPALAGEAPRPRVGEVLLTVLDRSLRLLHPVMPHLTEELWQRLPGREAVHPETIVLAAYPEREPSWEDDGVEASIGALIEVVGRVRNVRKELGLPDREEVRLWLDADEAGLAAFLAEQAALVAFLCRAGAVAAGEPPAAAARDLVAGVRLAVLAEERELAGEERLRLERELAKLDGEIAGAERRLANEQFLAKAPPAVVAGNRDRLAELHERRRGILAGLGLGSAAPQESGAA